MGGKRLCDEEGMNPKGPLCKHFLPNNLNGLSRMERYSPDFCIPKVVAA